MATHEKPKNDYDPVPTLPAPVQAAMPPPGHGGTEQANKIHPGVIICIWIALSSSVILYNKAILDNFGFEYPVFLTTWHLCFATIGTRILLRTTRLLDGLHNVQMSWDQYFRSIVPIGALFSASLIFSNMAYITLSVSFIQMLKAFTSVAVLILSTVMGLQHPDRRTIIVVICISIGVMVASYGEIQFAMSGFIFQSLGIFFEAARLVSIEKLLHGMKMDPLVSLYYFAPVCALINACTLPFTEGLTPFYLAWDRLGPFILLTNASCAFCLNIAVVFLIGCASSLVLTLSGVLKDILLVAASVMVLGSIVTFTQLVGYTVALVGLFVFKTKPEVLQGYLESIKGVVRR